MKRSFILIVMLCLLLPAVIIAQGVTTGAFAGRVVDIDGKPVLGAQITILHVPTGTQYTTLTRGNGRYDMPGVKVGGPYTVTAGYEGFKPETMENLTVKLGETKELNFTLQLPTVDAGEVEVTATNEVINPYRTGASQNVVRETIDALPTISRSLSDFTRLSPQMVSNEEAPGAFAAGGRNSRYNNIQIDGAQNNDLFGLGSSGTPGAQTDTTPISLETVQEFQIVMAPYDVRQGMFTGGGVNIITKAGTNQFHGSAYWEGRNQKFVGDGPSDLKFTKFNEGTYGLTFGGPIIKNKFFFFVSGEIAKTKQPGDYYIDGSGTGYDFGHKDEADRFISIMRDQYGYDAGGYGPISNDRTSNKIFARLDWNISDKHRLSLRHNYVDAEKDSWIRDNTRSFYFGNAGVIYLNKTHSTGLQINSVLSGNLHNELILNYSTIRDKPTYMGEPFPYIVVSTGGVTFYGGSEEYRHRNQLDQDLLEITDSLTWYKGKHTFILGTHNEIFKFYNVYVQRSFGKYEFKSLDDLAAGKPNRYDRYYSLTGDPNAPAQFKVNQLGLFIGDEWAVSPNFTLTLGLRADVPLMPDDPPYNALVEQKFGYRTDQTAGGNMLWSPRLGFNVDIFGNQDTQLRGGIGVFSGRTPYVWISNQYSNNGTDLARYYITSNVPFFVTDPFNQPTSPTAVYSGDINLITKDYRFPQVLKTNIAIDQKLPMGFIGTLEFVYSKGIKEIKYRNINIGPNGQYNKIAGDGRPLFGTPSTSGSSKYGSPNYLNREFREVLLLSNTDKGYEYSLAFQLQKEWKGGNMFTASYTYGMSKDLNSGTSSRAISNWGYNITTWDPNDPQLTYSTHDTRHRIVFAMTRKFDFFQNAPTWISLFYSGRSGRPYSTIYFNDYNGDGQVNDSIWVPASADQVILTRGTWAELDKYISSDPALDKNRGKIMPRNASRDPWYHGVDLKIAQNIPVPGLKGHRLQLQFTLQNVLNLFDKRWGVYRYIPFDDSPLTFLGYDSATGKPKFEFWGKTTTDNARYTINQLLSRWKALFGIKYEF